MSLCSSPRACDGSRPAGRSAEGQEGREGAPVAALKPRLVGPAVTSGRVVGFAVHPNDRSHYFVAVASRRRVEDDQRRHDLDAGLRRRRLVLHRLRRARSEEPERRLGRHRREQQPAQRRLRRRRLQEHRRRQDVGERRPEDERTHRQDPDRPARLGHGLRRGAGAALGTGGDRGLYKTTDGGKTWNKVLDIGENTGVTDVVLDPRNPDVLLAATYQRRRHVWTLINGGPGSAIHRSTDGGKTWKKITQRLARRRPRPHRPGDRADRPGHRLRHRRGGRQRGRHLPLHRSRRDVGEAQPLRGRRRSTTRTSSSIRRTRTAST